MIRFLVLISIVACERHESPPEIPPKPIDAPPVPIDSKPPKPDCKSQGELDGEVTSAYVAMENWPHYRKAIALWKSTQPDCRTGRWYLAAARLVDLTKDPLEVDAIRFETGDAALAIALKQPDDIAVLARVAEVSAYGRQIVLPSDACPRARAAAAGPSYHEQQARFVCARRAIEDGDGAAAKTELSSFGGGSADAELARAQAAVLRGEHLTAKRHAAKAIEAAGRPNNRMPSVDHESIVRLARQIQ